MHSAKRNRVSYVAARGQVVDTVVGGSNTRETHPARHEAVLGAGLADDKESLGAGLLPLEVGEFRLGQNRLLADDTGWLYYGLPSEVPLR